MNESKNTPPLTPFKLLLIGDSCIDEYVYGICTRLNPEAPVPVMDYSKTETKPGMAANVFENLKAFNTQIDFITNTETIIKTRYVDAKYNHQILRVDRHQPVVPFEKTSFEKKYDAIIISDYNKGFISSKVLFEIVEKNDVPIFVDTKKKDIPVKENCFVKINESEFKALNNPPSNIIVTLGDKGAMYKDKIYPTARVTVFDVVGAGDTFLAALAFYYLSTQSIEAAIPYANKASAIAVQHTGTYVLTADDVKAISAV